MPREPHTAGPDAHRPATAFGPTARALTLLGATLTTGLVSGVFYAYEVSVDPALAGRPDAEYVSTMQAINEKIQNPAFFLGFFGAVVALLAALAAHLQRPRSGRFVLVALACALYVGGGFLLTAFVNVPLNERLARVAPDAAAGELARARAAYEGPWNFWNGVRAVSSGLSFLALVTACLLREDRDA